MNEQHHGNLLGGAIGETTQAAAQLATILATAAQTALRLQTHRFEVDQAADQAAADVQRVELRREHTAARLDWAPALQPGFKTSGSTTDAATLWASAQPWVDHDPSAREAARLAEERLGVLHPELIVRYQERLADGLDPIDAMVVATVVLTPTPDDVNGAAAARAVAGDERGDALQHAAVPDVAATASVDEHTQGIYAGATHAAVSDAASARAALLAAQAYPQPLRVALPRTLHTTLGQPRVGRDVRYRRGR
ncbi:MAG TPA: hypothetical protein VG034_26885 [Acidimicrobiia bacterium]|jgi:hypothetical protein|nr:hypothetical protein [Acidimicrobiia bacterium]